MFGAEIDKTGTLFGWKRVVRALVSCFVDFGHFAAVAVVARASFRGLRPKVLVQ